MMALWSSRFPLSMHIRICAAILHVERGGGGPSVCSMVAELCPV